MNNSLEGSLLPFPLPAEGIFNILRERNCAICLEPLLNAEDTSGYLRQLGCGHLFHTVCVINARSDGWLREEDGAWTKKPCALCRQAVQRVGDVFSENAVTEDKTQRIQITLATSRGPLAWAFLFVDENTKMKKIMEVCSQMLGLSCSYVPSERPLPFLVDYVHQLEYSPALDPNDKTLQQFGIKNGENMILYHTYKFI